MILGGDRVARKKIDNLVRGEARVSEARNNLVDRVKRVGHQTRRRGDREIQAACQELQAWGTGTVADADRAGKLNAKSTCLGKS